MNKNLERKENTRRRMLEAASKSFRSQGFAGVGVDAIAKEAGATSGAFYAHLGSKDGAIRAAIELGLDEVIEAIPAYQDEHGDGWIDAFADYYLGKAHRKDLACGCAMTTLSPEVARAAPELRAVYEAKMKKIVDLVADGLAGKSHDDRVARAWAMLGTLIGGLTLARAVKTGTASDAIVSSIRTAAIKAAGRAK